MNQILTSRLQVSPEELRSFRGDRGELILKHVALAAREFRARGMLDSAAVCISLETAHDLQKSKSFKKYDKFVMKNDQWLPWLYGMKINVNKSLLTNEIFVTTDKRFVDKAVTLEDIDRAILRSKLKNNLVILIKNRCHSFGTISKEENIAIESLRELITETMFRKYLKFGFILVQGQSGSIYQIFRNKSHTKVWRGGKIIEEVCVRIKSGKIPPTDNLIAFKTMIEVDEEEFRKAGNLYIMEKAA